MNYEFNPLIKKGFDKVGLSQTELEALFLKLDQTTPQTTIGGFKFPSIGINKTASSDIGIELLNKSGKQGLRIQNPNSTDIAFSTYKTGDGSVRFSFLGDGMQKWSPGTSGPDTALYRSGANELTVDSNGSGGTANLVVTGNIKSDSITEETPTLLKLDQTTPQTILNDTFKLDTLKSKSVLGTDANGKIIEGSASGGYYSFGADIPCAVDNRAFLQMNWAGTIESIVITGYDSTGASVSGSVVLDIWKDTDANYPPTVADTITASAKPTISTGVKASDSTLTGWTKTFSAGDWFVFNVDSFTDFAKVRIQIKYTRS